MRQSHWDYKFRMSAVKENQYRATLLEAHIIRLCHSIEKGLSIEAPRLGFGVAKINELFKMAGEYRGLNTGCDFCLNILRDALKEYFVFHDEKGFDSEDYRATKTLYKEFFGDVSNSDEKYGGTQSLCLNDLDYNINEIEKLFYTRHSVREFSGEDVDIELVKKAVHLAQTAPSACNRQAVRVYAIKPDKYIKDMNTNLEGIGGFAEDVSYFLLITGKVSAYSDQEVNQFAVSASIFAGYLSLALHAYKIGACIVQRGIRYTKQWEEFAKANGIPGDEQIVCMIGIGCLKDTTTVPISKRFDTDKIFTVL